MRLRTVNPLVYCCCLALPIGGCGSTPSCDDDPSSCAGDAATSTSTSEPGGDGDGDGDGDGEPSGNGDGDNGPGGDGDGDNGPGGDGDGDSGGDGDGDGDGNSGGDGDGDSGGDGDGDSGGDGDGDSGGDGDGDGDGDSGGDGDGDGDGDSGGDGDGDVEEPPLECADEQDCEGPKLNLLFVIDYSTSANQMWQMDPAQTRWEVIVDTFGQAIVADSTLTTSVNLALMRYGHDPSPQMGTMIQGDQSGIVDGHHIDIHWDNEANEYQCNADAFVDTMETLDPPLQGQEFGIGTWTKGALEAALVEIAETSEVHVDDTYAIVLITDGQWTSVDGTLSMAPESENPVIAADSLWSGGVATYVIAVGGDPGTEAVADEVAAAGGTTAAFDADTPELLGTALDDIINTLVAEAAIPDCSG